MSTFIFGKQWLLNTNNLVGYVTAGAAQQNGWSMMMIKDVIKGGTGKYGWTDQNGNAVSAPTFWTVDYSCDSTTAGTPGDGSDKWTAYNKVIWGTVAGANSWIVLKNTTAGLWLLLNCESGSSDSNTIDAYVSKVGFTGGTTTTRPSATDEQNICNVASWGTGAAFNIRFHVMMSTDGKHLRVFTTRAMNLQGVWLIEPMSNTEANVENSLIASIWGGAGSNALGVSTLSSVPQNIARKSGGPTVLGVLTGEGSTYVTNLQATLGLDQRPLYNDISAKNQVGAVNAYALTPAPSATSVLTNPMRGKLGSLIDLWWGSDRIASGRTFPNDGTRQLVSIGPLVIPWNRLIPEFH